MSGPQLDPILASGLFWVHVGVILFNVFGLVAVPLGAWLGWRFVRILWWRALHLAALGVVALQALLGRACLLTLWQSDLASGTNPSPGPLIQRWVSQLIYWPLPIQVFAALYVAIWIYVLALWWLVRPGRRRE